MYGLAVILSQIFINLSLTNKVCGESQWGSVMLVTFIPWILIFGSLSLVINNFPGWLKPFSNTFGYFIISYKLKNAFNSILKINNRTDDLEKIYNNSKNQNLIINEIPPNEDGFNNFINHLNKKKLLNSNIKNSSEEIIILKNLIKLKNIISEFIWYILTGILTILVSYNYIINLKCSLSPEETEIMNTKNKIDTEKSEDEEYINNTNYNL